ncbi:MAG: TVP38/TMEM64 family protein, partial [Pseudomonadota bacterium]
MSVDETIGNTEVEKVESKSRLKRFLPIGIIAAFLGGGYALGLHNYLSVDALQENRDAIQAFVSENFVLSIVAYLGIYIVAVALSFPGASILTIAGGAIFGWFIGGTLTV